MKKIIFLFALLILTSCSVLNTKEENSNSLINFETKIEIRGSKQYIKVFGKSKDNPVLLFLHGGPGGAYTPYYEIKFKELENDFTVVMWDQREAGKSYGFIADKYQTIDSFVEDTKEVTNYLKKKLKKEKIFLVGSSWGAFLGIKTIKKYPNDYFAFIGTGIPVNMQENDSESYRLLLQEAEDTNNKKLELKLRKLEEPHDKRTTLRYYTILVQYEQGVYTKSNVFIRSVFRLFNVKYYNKGFAYIPQIVNLNMNLKYSTLHKEFDNSNLGEEVKKIDIPVYFLAGKKDFRTPYTFVEKYCETLNAPKKKLIWFENSGHSPEYEEPLKFIEIMKNIKVEIENQKFGNYSRG